MSSSTSLYTSTTHAFNPFRALSPVRLVANANQTGTYFNGPTNSGNGATFTYASGVLTIDSVVTNLNDYILLAGQTLAFQNGIYQIVVNGAVGVAAVLQRRGDQQSIEQFKLGQFVPVVAGTAFGGSMWMLIEPFPGGIGLPATTNANNIVYAQV
jgi:hypothetical protein